MPHVTLHRLCLGMACLALLLVADAAPAQVRNAQLVSVKRIWDQGQHNAFTDLIRYQDQWFCTFREAEGHVGGDGKLRVLVSQDGETWESAALLSEAGVDLRDPKLSITVDNQLMLVAGGSVYGGTKTLKSMQPRLAFSPDGRNWTPMRRVLSEGQWLWRVTWHEGRAYGCSYEPATQANPEGRLTLVVSDDGVIFTPHARLEIPGRPNEATLVPLATGELMALVRREGGNRMGWIGISKPPMFRQWTWKETGMRLGGPNFIELPDGSLWAGTREYAGALREGEAAKGTATVLARMTRDSLEPVLLLPSSGDNSYPGMVWHDNLLWMSYYSSHEGKAAIFLAKIRLTQ